MVRVGILGAAGYTGGELIRVLLNHPEAEIVFANSESNAGNPVCEVHEGLYGETDLCFTSEMPWEQVDVVFFCFGHGKSRAFLQEHDIPAHVRIIHLANPGCFATCIQLALLPALKAGMLSGDIHVNGITGSTGAGQKPGATTHYSWRNDNISVYKTFTHQHLLEINQTVQELHPGYDGRVLFIPQRGCFARGIYVTAYAKCDASLEEVQKVYADYYQDAEFTHFVVKSPDMKQVVNTNKAVVYVEKYEDQLLMICCIDNLLKGAVGQAVQNMNLMFGLDEKAGLNLKASAF